MSPTLPFSHFNDEFRSADGAHTKSLTPQRKHRKLLKDGSGIEVWPESVEKIFVKGLRKYWESPYATSSQSRGRSRWRNQFLVDYLKSAGVERSKKQVASHIQVLRNMWKGEPGGFHSSLQALAVNLESEFHLVAGGEESYSEPTCTSIKLEEQRESPSVRYAEYDDADSSSNGTSPNFSPPEVKTEFPPSPGMSSRVFPPDAQPTLYSPMPDGLVIPSMIPVTSQRALPANGDSLQISTCLNYDYSVPSSFVPQDQFVHGISVPQTVSHRYVGKQARVKAFKLTAEGVNPFCVRLDALASHVQLAPHTPLSLKLKLGISNINTILVGHRFTANLYFTCWSHSEKCSTKVFINGQMESSEDTSLSPIGSSNGCLVAALPESHFNRCRWLDPSLSVVVTQEITADDQTLLFIVYMADLTMGDLAPAQLLSYWKYNQTDKTAAAHASIQTGQEAIAHHPYSSSPSHSDQVPYIYAPTQPCHGRYALSTSMTC
ncbi:hypothetical protein AX15_003994 [Amanita polypyramis BW_CC]|nr:hypothetical protein AX15_003994 [Amanita polypyramis BW_CC]